MKSIEIFKEMMQEEMDIRRCYSSVVFSNYMKGYAKGLAEGFREKGMLTEKEYISETTMIAAVMIDEFLRRRQDNGEN